MTDFEEILEDLGTFGPYQVRVFLLVSAFETPAAWAMFLPVFTHAAPTWICPTNTTFSGGNITGNFTEGYCTPEGEYCDGVSFTDDMSSILTDFNLCGDNPIPSFITTLQMVGVLIGACITGQLADMFGRRKVFYLVYSLFLLTGALTSLSPMWELYALGRVFVGAFFGGTMLINFVLPLEFVGPKWRTFCGCVGFWAVGVMLLAPLAYFIQNWRYLTLVTSLVGLPLILTWWYVPESPRWLVQCGRLKEAQKVLNMIAKFNKKQNIDMEKLNHCFKVAANKKSYLKKYSYWDLFRNCKMTKNTLIILYSWFVSSAVYYGTSLSVGNLSGNKYVNFSLSGLVELPALVFVLIVNNRIGRKKTISILMITAGLSCLCILALNLLGVQETHSWLVTSSALLGKAGIAGAWAAVQVFSAETFPTVIRNIGVGASSMSARIGGIVAPILASLIVYSKPLPFTVFGALALLCGILCFFIPETLNKPLPEGLPPRGRFWNCCHSKQQTSANLSEHLSTGNVENAGHSFLMNGNSNGHTEYMEAEGKIGSELL